MWMVGIDTGGTFTDLIAVNAQSGEARLAKVPSTPDDPSRAVLDALQRLSGFGIAASDINFFAHGTTVATNALLEMKGARAGLLVTRNFRAVYEARGRTQPRGVDLIDPYFRKPPLLVSQELTEEVHERLDYRGQVLEPLDEERLRASIRNLRSLGIESVAVCFLYSFLNAAHETRVAEIIAEEAPELRISLSSSVLPVMREYARLATTVLDAYVGPKVANYLLRLAGQLRKIGLTTPQVFLMQSNGGLTRISIAARHANQTLISGPAAGVIAAAELARAGGDDHVVTFDMGGTSTDISLVVKDQMLETSEGQIGGHDIATPMLKVRTLGAGGGTLAWIGKDGLLKVGPLSSGAVPGPACYGRGGHQPTVTDANLLLGALSKDMPLAGELRLDETAAREAVATHVGEPLGLDTVEAAAGIIRIVNTHMAVDLRLALQEEGQDPRHFALVAFGGAGPLHASYLARSVNIPRVIIPISPGIHCAMGLLKTSVKHAYFQSSPARLGQIAPQQVWDIFTHLEALAREETREEGFSESEVRFTRKLEMRYPMQGYQLAIPCPFPRPEDFDKELLRRTFDERHRQMYGQAATDEDPEIITFRLESEVDVKRPPDNAPPAPHTGESALKGTRPLYDVDHGAFHTASVYTRELLRPGDVIAGPAVIEQFDATTIVLADQRAVCDRFSNLIITFGGQHA